MSTDPTPEHVRRVINRFEQFISPEPNTGCWLFEGAGEPYGVFWVDGASVSAHRFSCLAYSGPIADGLHVDHKCRVKCCVNPDHLEPVTHQENMARKLQHGNQYTVSGACKRGHEMTPENTYTSPRGLTSCRECNRIRVNTWKRENRHVRG